MRRGMDRAPMLVGVQQLASHVYLASFQKTSPRKPCPQKPHFSTAKLLKQLPPSP